MPTADCLIRGHWPRPWPSCAGRAIRAWPVVSPCASISPTTERDLSVTTWPRSKPASTSPAPSTATRGSCCRKPFFRELGGFREDLPVLEDTLLAERLRSRGRWLLLPGIIVTAPRRFQAEGFRQRQTLNALLMNFAITGWDEPLRRSVDAYRSQDRARPLDLALFYREIDRLLDELPWSERLRIWYRTGGFVRANVWQLALRHRVRRAFSAGLPPEAVPLEPVLRFRRGCDAFTDHPPGRLLAALLTWLWFRTRQRQPLRGA